MFPKFTLQFHTSSSFLQLSFCLFFSGTAFYLHSETDSFISFLCDSWNFNDINHPERSLIPSIRARMEVLKVIFLWQIIHSCLMSQVRDCPLPMNSVWILKPDMAALIIHSLEALLLCGSLGTCMIPLSHPLPLSFLLQKSVPENWMVASLPRGFIKRQLIWGPFSKLHRDTWQTAECGLN